MITLGIESTAHTFGVGVVKDGKPISNVRDMYVPETGGIHPREAADHHVVVGSEIVQKAILEAGITELDIDLISFSKGPGLGPCLRVGATIGRVLSIKNEIPIIGSNHCVAHLEIGSLFGAQDPVLLYTSGGNTQVIAFVKKRYMVLGETLDIGIGNMLDKLGREIGIPFPAGPKIELLAAGAALDGIWDEENEPGFMELPYSVKGMDMSFSGILTAALGLYRKGVSIPTICRSVQETCFSMLCEVTERAMAHIGSEEVLLGGGVACNRRLKEMVSALAEERGAASFFPTPDLAVDNGAMIAVLGERMYQSGIRHSLEDTVIDQKFRTDQVEVLWKEEKEVGRIRTPGTVEIERGSLPPAGELIGRGAEALITRRDLGSVPGVEKKRISKGYRIREMDRYITAVRTKNESRMLRSFRDLGIRTPFVLDVDLEEGVILMEALRGPRLAASLNVLDEEEQRLFLREMGSLVGIMHSGDVVHGDLTTSNFIILPEDEGHPLGVIDCSLSERTAELEKKGVDLRLFFEVFRSTHGSLQNFEDEFWKGYLSHYPKGKEARDKMEEIDQRGRYLSGRWTQ
ncbi:MAG: bifunctional N(6)-L-threonylcarbamoyladenine synthase/serine/threonine protein kinase [Thermoplasmatota archaeon]